MLRHRKRLFFKIGIVAFVVAVGLLLLLGGPPDVDNSEKIVRIERSIRSVANRVGCQLAHLPIDNPEIMQFYKPVGKIICGDPMDDWVMCEKSICFVKPQIITAFGAVSCSYTDLIRKDDFRVRYGKSTQTTEPYVLQASDFVRVVCRAENGQKWFGMAAGIRDTVARNVPINSNLLFGVPPLVNLDANGAAEEVPPPYFSVLMFGFDSLSRNAFMRKLPKTYEYLTKNLHAIVLKGYNIVGDGTPQALIPLMTGYTELELPETRRRKRFASPVDVYPFVWKDFMRQGYMTSFNEDLPNVGTFTYRMKGFTAQPVDHYLRPYYVEAANILTSSKSHCIGYQPDHVVMLDYTKNFMLKYPDSPRFVFSFHGGLSHDSINLIGAADDDVFDWLSTLKIKKVLDNTILIFMSDHGNRFANVRATLQGKQEERLPFFSFAFPESFRKRFPKEYANFVENSERLTTPFDVHATLKDLIRLQRDKEPAANSDEAPVEQDQPDIKLSPLAAQRAISLFDEVPRNRSCAEAYIEPHWCACLQWQPAAMDDPSNAGLLLKLTASIVDSINNATQDFRTYCAPLTLKKVNWVMRLRPQRDLLQFKQSSDRDGYVADLTDQMHINSDMYQLQLALAPGDSLFEATVSYNLQTFTAHTRLSEVSRINKYGSQANCIYERNPELRKYCFCKG